MYKVGSEVITEKKITHFPSPVDPVCKFITKEMSNMPAYMVNEYYVFTSYEDMSSLIHDVLHYSLLPEHQKQHSFSVLMGQLDTQKLIFNSDHGHSISVRYESEEDIYYSL